MPSPCASQPGRITNTDLTATASSLALLTEPRRIFASIGVPFSAQVASSANGEIETRGVTSSCASSHASSSEPTEATEVASFLLGSTRPSIWTGRQRGISLATRPAPWWAEPGPRLQCRRASPWIRQSRRLNYSKHF